MTIKKVNSIVIDINSEEALMIAYALFLELKATVNTHIIHLQQNSKEDFTTRERVFKEQKEKELKAMMLFYNVGGFSETGKFKKEALYKAVHDKEEVT